MKKILFFIATVLVVLSGCEKSKSTDPYSGYQTEEVVSCFEYKLYQPHYVAFTNKSVNAGNYKWDFGDGEKSAEKNPIHQYKKMGVYKVKLTAEYLGVSDESEATLTIEDPTTCYISGFTYNKVANLDKYYKIKVTDNDKLFINTWVVTDYVMLGQANLPYTYDLATPKVDPKQESDYYWVYVYWANNKSAEGEQLLKQKLSVTDLYNKYLESVTLNNNDKNTQVVVRFMWK